MKKLTEDQIETTLDWECGKCGIDWDNDTNSRYNDEYYCDECIDMLASHEACEVLEDIKNERILREYYKIKIEFEVNNPTLSINGGAVEVMEDYYVILGLVLKTIKSFEVVEGHAEMIEDFEDTYGRFK